MSVKSLKRHEGWLMIDHRAGAGLPEHVARMMGLDPAECRGGMVYEAGTITCSHCKTVFAKNKFRVRPREYCKLCDHYICDGCGAEASSPDYNHTPFEKKIEAAMESAHRGVAFDITAPVPSTPTIIVP